MLQFEQDFLLLTYLLLPILFLLFLLLVELGLTFPHIGDQLILQNYHLLLFAINWFELIKFFLGGRLGHELIVELVVSALEGLDLSEKFLFFFNVAVQGC